MLCGQILTWFSVKKIDHRNDVCFTSKNKTKQKNPQVSLALVQQYEVEQVLGFV